MKRYFFGHFVSGVAAIAAFSAVVMLLWNALVPDIFGFAVINYWQSLGLLALSRLLFGGLGGMLSRGGFAGMPRGGFGKNPLREKWEKMTPEERKEFVKSRRFGGGWEGAYERGHCDGHDFGGRFEGRHEREFANDEPKNNIQRD